MASKDNLEEVLYRAAKNKETPAGDKYLSLGMAEAAEIAGAFEESLRSIEISALEHQIVPERYQRNMGTIGLTGQIKLLSSRVAVIGLGGLGGIVTELLARSGVGSMLLIDGDNFSENNLNRQIVAHELNIHQQKTAETKRRVEIINGAVEVISYSGFVDNNDLVELLEDVHLAIDCLDNMQTRFDLEFACQSLEIPMVHGAIAGNAGQIAVIWPGNPLLSVIYGKSEAADDAASFPGQGVEIVLGNPAVTPALLGAWEVSEAIKVLLGREEALKDELLHVDLQHNEIVRVPL